MAKKNKNTPVPNPAVPAEHTPADKSVPEIPDYSPHTQTRKPEINRTHGEFKN